MSAVSWLDFQTSSAWISGESSSPNDAWIPPCAFAELHDWSEPFVATATRAPARSADTAAARPGGAAADHEHVEREPLGHGQTIPELMRRISPANTQNVAGRTSVAIRRTMITARTTR